MSSPRPAHGLPLLATKLHAPRPRATTVPRPRLRARFGTERRALTLVSAAAGFGKTTLVADWLADRPGTAWLALDERDRDPERFWAYVVAALRTVVPGLGAHAEAALAAAPPDLEAAVALLLNDLDALDHEVTLVLDDYHAVDGPGIEATMTFLLAHLPPQLALVIVTRADPALPLAGLRAGGHLVEVRAADLRFDAAEAAEYLNATMGLTLAPADVQALEARTEGWIAALQLAALSLQGRADAHEFIAGFAGDDRFVLDYLAGEVLERLDEGTRAFLLQTSILTRLEGSLCDAVTGQVGGKATLERLDRANLFLVPLDDRRAWYRYHHLFADVLHARLLDERPEELAALHGRASDWHRAHGDLPEAIRHALAAPDLDRAAELIELAVPAMRQARREATMRTWFEALPPEVLTHRPVLALGYVGALMASGSFEPVDALLEVIDRALEGADGVPISFVDEEGFASLTAQLAIQRAGLALVRGDPAAAVAHADRALEHATADDHLRRGSAAALVGLAHWATGDLPTAEQRYAEAIPHLEAAGYLSDTLGCCLALSDIRRDLGRLGAAQQALERGLDLAARHHVLRGTADLHVGLAELHLERDDLDAAAAELQASTELGEAAALVQHAYRSRVVRACLAQRTGATEDLWSTLAEAEARFDTDFSPPVRPVAATAARLRLAERDVGAAADWAATRGLAVDDELTYLAEHEHLTLARLLLAQGDPEGAARLVDRLHEAAAAGGRVPAQVEALVVRAHAHDALGQRDATNEALEQALLLAAPEGHARALRDLGTADLLGRADLGPDARAVADWILGRGGDRPAPAPTRPTGLVEELSARELDVLRLLRSDLSGPDIARELIVSLNTLRTHTKSIYAKLGVRSRREAVTRARELGL